MVTIFKWYSLVIILELIHRNSHLNIQYHISSDIKDSFEDTPNPNRNLDQPQQWKILANRIGGIVYSTICQVQPKFTVVDCMRYKWRLSHQRKFCYANTSAFYADSRSSGGGICSLAHQGVIQQLLRTEFIAERTLDK